MTDTTAPSTARVTTASRLSTYSMPTLRLLRFSDMTIAVPDGCAEPSFLTAYGCLTEPL